MPEATKPATKSATAPRPLPGKQPVGKPQAAKPLVAQPLADEDFYYDGPYMVFTAAYHLKRGYCCNSGCRHCPYDE